MVRKMDGCNDRSTQVGVWWRGKPARLAQPTTNERTNERTNDGQRTDSLQSWPWPWWWFWWPCPAWLLPCRTWLDSKPLSGFSEVAWDGRPDSVAACCPVGGDGTCRAAAARTVVGCATDPSGRSYLLKGIVCMYATYVCTYVGTLVIYRLSLLVYGERRKGISCGISPNDVLWYTLPLSMASCSPYSRGVDVTTATVTGDGMRRYMESGRLAG